MINLKKYNTLWYAGDPIEVIKRCNIQYVHHYFLILSLICVDFRLSCLYLYAVCVYVCVSLTDGESDCGHAGPWHGHEDEKPEAAYHCHSTRHDRCVCVCPPVHQCEQAQCGLIGLFPVVMHNAAMNFGEYCLQSRGRKFVLFSCLLSLCLSLFRPWHHWLADPEIQYQWGGWVNPIFCVCDWNICGESLFRSDWPVVCCC